MTSQQKQTIILDSMNRYFELIYPYVTTFKWYLTDTISQTSNTNNVYTKNKIQYIHKITMHNFTLPISVYNNIKYSDIIRCTFPQLTNESFFNDSHNNINKFHIESVIKKKINDRILLYPKNDIIFSPSYHSINELDVKFYDPYELYKFDLDFGYYKIIFGNPTLFELINPSNKLIDFNEPEIKGILLQNITINTGSKIIILTNITSPDINLNKLLNNKNGHNICKLDNYRFSIPLDTSKYNGYIQDNILIYYYNKRFNIIMDIFYYHK